MAVVVSVVVVLEFAPPKPAAVIEEVLVAPPKPVIPLVLPAAVVAVADPMVLVVEVPVVLALTVFVAPAVPLVPLVALAPVVLVDGSVVLAVAPLAAVPMGSDGLGSELWEQAAPLTNASATAAARRGGLWRLSGIGRISFHMHA